MAEGRGEEDGAVYVISVAAELAGMHPQTLRQYDRIGLVTPIRTKGRGRRYTQDDISLLRRIQTLSQEEGINLAGIQRIMALEEELRQLRDIVHDLRSGADSPATPIHRVFSADSHGRINTRSPNGAPRRDVVPTRSASRQLARQEAWHLQLPPHIRDLFALYLLSHRKAGDNSSE